MDSKLRELFKNAPLWKAKLGEVYPLGEGKEFLMVNDYPCVMLTRNEIGACVTRDKAGTIVEVEARIVRESFDDTRTVGETPSVDEEIEAIGVAMRYLENADPRSRERFMFHLRHRFFPGGRFIPVEDSPEVEINMKDFLKEPTGDIPGRLT